MPVEPGVIDANILVYSTKVDDAEAGSAVSSSLTRPSQNLPVFNNCTIDVNRRYWHIILNDKELPR